MKDARLYLGMNHLQNRKIVYDSVHKLTYNILKRNLCTQKVTIASRSYDKLMIDRKIFCKLGPWPVR